MLIGIAVLLHLFGSNLSVFYYKYGLDVGMNYPLLSKIPRQVRSYAQNIGLVKSAEKSSAGVRKVELTPDAFP